MKKALACLLALLLTGVLAQPALAAPDEAALPEMQAISPWAYDALADIYALGMWSDDYYYCILDPVTQEQLEALCTAVADKLAALSLAPNPNPPQALVVDGTRAGVKNALYQTAAAYDVPYADTDAYFMLGELGAAFGDGVSQTDALDARVCTLQEALVMASRLVLNIYDYYNAGSLGLLWRAENNGVTLYLLGTIHVDRSNVYPFHRQLRELITGADAAVFEVDLNDVDGILAFMRMQMYQDGSTLADYISPALYQQTVEAMASLGLPEEQTALYKPWALANTLQAMAMTDESTGETFMAVDSYVNAAAVNVGVPIGAVETYEFQAGLFDALTPEYQEAYLESALSLFLGEDTAGEGDAAAAELESLDNWMQFWKARNIDAFSASYDKDAYLESTDELTAQLYLARDPGMIAAAAAILEGEYASGGETHVIMVVGAGHMIGDTGIVQGLRDLGYTVEEVPAP